MGQRGVKVVHSDQQRLAAQKPAYVEVGRVTVRGDCGKLGRSHGPLAEEWGQPVVDDVRDDEREQGAGQ